MNLCVVGRSLFCGDSQFGRVCPFLRVFCAIVAIERCWTLRSLLSILFFAHSTDVSVALRHFSVAHCRVFGWPLPDHSFVCVFLCIVDDKHILYGQIHSGLLKSGFPAKSFTKTNYHMGAKYGFIHRQFDKEGNVSGRHFTSYHRETASRYHAAWPACVFVAAVVCCSEPQPMSSPRPLTDGVLSTMRQPLRLADSDCCRVPAQQGIESTEENPAGLNFDDDDLYRLQGM